MFLHLHATQVANGLMDAVPEVSCAACEHDSKIRILATLVCYISRNYEDIDSRDLLGALDVVAKATRGGAR